MSDTLARINWVDILIIILLVRTSYIGYTQGLSYEALTLFGIIGAVLLTLHNYEYLGEYFQENINLPVDFSNFLSFLIFGIGTLFFFRYLRNAFASFIKFEVLYSLERYGGLIFGFIRGSLTASLLLVALVLVPNDYIRTSVKEKSFAGLMFLKITPVCYEYSIGQFPRYKETKKNKFVAEVLSHKPSESAIKSHRKKQQKK